MGKQTDTSGVLSDNRMSMKLKRKVYRTVVGSALTYDLETIPMKNINEKEMEVLEIE